MAWRTILAASAGRAWTLARSRLAILTAAYVASMSYSLFLAGATQDLSTIWAANAVGIAGLLILNRLQGAALLALTAALHLVIETAIGDPPRFVLFVAVLDTVQIALTAALLRLCHTPIRVRDMRTIHIAPWADVGNAFKSDTPVHWPGMPTLASDFPRKR